MRTVRQAQELPGQQLFQYLDESGDRRSLSSQDVNDYLREATGADFTSKHFRTWGGTKTAVSLFAGMPRPETQRQTRITLNGLIDTVAQQLGNTRAVCRNSYIHPAIVEAYLDGTLAPRWQRPVGQRANRLSVSEKKTVRRTGKSIAQAQPSTASSARIWTTPQRPVAKRSASSRAAPRFRH